MSLVALALALAVASYGALMDRRDAAIVGLIATVVSASAMALRGRESIRAAERSSEWLTTALADSERDQQQLRLANETLQRTNANLRTLQIAVAQGFNLIDERTRGRLRELVEEAGDDLAALVDERLDD